ncbi:MAG: hypothetical protein EBV31_01305 [Verrucomicrobia bacterium]|jgi:hypothetical protein|nr:hypothetical protein [Verrucomicrobiota bacterium]
MKAFLLLLPVLAVAQAPVVSGDAELWGAIGGKPLVIRTTSRLAGAIDSVKWDGVEFIDSHDHGRQLQSALNADVDGVFHVECYNPTEAGSVADALGPKSTSRLEFLSVQDGLLSTRTRMAFWLAPGMRSHGQPAQNTAPLSEHVLAKQVRIGRPGMDHVLDYKVTFTVPADRPHKYLQFEALTGYMPATFSEEHRFDAKTATLVPVPRKNGEIRDPIVLSTPSGSHAMGVFTPDRPPAGQPPVGYGRFEFEPEKVVKWNCVFRLRQTEPIKPGDHSFQLYVVIGTREDCRRTLAALAQEFAGR